MLDLALLWHGSTGDQSYKHSLALFLSHWWWSRSAAKSSREARPNRPQGALLSAVLTLKVASRGVADTGAARGLARGRRCATPVASAALLSPVAASAASRSPAASTSVWHHAGQQGTTQSMKHGLRCNAASAIKGLLGRMYGVAY